MWYNALVYKRQIHYPENQMNLKKITQNKIFKAVLPVILALAALITAACSLLPSKIDNFTTDATVCGMEKISVMQKVENVAETTVFQNAQDSLASVIGDSDSPAYLSHGLEEPQSVADSASRSYFMSAGVSLSSSEVSVDISPLGYLIQKLDLSGTDNTIKIINGTGKALDSDASALEALVSQSGKEVSFLAVRIRDGAAVAYNTDKYFPSCSTIKAPFCLYVAKLISEGKLDWEQSVPYTSDDYMSGSGEIKNYSFGTRFKIKTLVEYSIGKSDNIAHNMLTSCLGTNGFYSMLDKLNCSIPTTQNTVWPESDARSSALWWSSIYEFRNSGSTGTWLWSLFENNYSKIRLALNDTKMCYTKTGSSSYCSHEAGIVMGNEPYLVVIYTKTTSGYGVSDSYFYSIAKEIDSIIAG